MARRFLRSVIHISLTATASGGSPAPIRSRISASSLSSGARVRADEAPCGVAAARQRMVDLGVWPLDPPSERPLNMLPLGGERLLKVLDHGPGFVASPPVEASR